VPKAFWQHILTTHTGSLPRPDQLVDLVYSKQEGKKVDEANFESLVSKQWMR
jgi:5-methyltetrahydropteroyltriglutamate--homocysteine methyltransferase